jgi:hypothetical protein
MNEVGTIIHVKMMKNDLIYATGTILAKDKDGCIIQTFKGETLFAPYLKYYYLPWNGERRSK